MSSVLLANLQGTPNRTLAVERYRHLAASYDESCRHIGVIRARAVAALELQTGETVFDVACGTGALLPVLAGAVGPTGHVVGIEQSPEMAALARRRIAAERLTNVSLLQTSVEEASFDRRADALLFTYTHDVLQSTAALERLSVSARPGARAVVVGMCLLPWWLAPVNVWLIWRARHYLTTYRGLGAPWRALTPYCPDLSVEERFHAGTSYLARGTMHAKPLRNDHRYERSSESKPAF